MSVCQSGQTDEDSASEEVGASARDLYKQKPASKVVRVLTVLAYLLSVSLAAILLSVYYVCAWKSPELPPLTKSEVGARQGNHSDYADSPDTTFYNVTGEHRNEDEMVETEESSTPGPSMSLLDLETDDSKLCIPGPSGVSQRHCVEDDTSSGEAV